MNIKINQIKNKYEKILSVKKICLLNNKICIKLNGSNRYYDKKLDYYNAHHYRNGYMNR